MIPRQPAVWTILIGLVLAGATPALANGTWLAAEGLPEPNTAYDAADVMQQHPNDAAHPDGVAERVYFNGFLITGYGSSSVNIAEGSPYPTSTRFAAFLGYWRDCNGDGYVGAKSVADAPAGSYGHWSNGAYPADAFPIDAALCPVGTPYNSGTFVDEFRWIGPNATESQEVVNRHERFRCDPTNWITVIEDCTAIRRDQQDVTDTDARMWADWGRPDSEATPTRPIFPAEMFDDSSNTIEIVNFATKIENHLESERTINVGGVEVFDGRLAEEGTWENKPNLGACDEDRTFMGGPDLVPGTGVGSCGLYPVWQVHRLYSDERGEENATELVTVFDTERDESGSGSACDDMSLPGGFAIPDPEPGVHEDPLMGGSVGGTLFRNVLPSLNEGGVAYLSGECGERGNPPGLLLSSTEAIQGKDSVDSALTFNPDERFRSARGYGVDDVPMSHLGLAYGARWTGTAGYITITRVPGATAPEFASYYADVSEEAFTNANFGGASPATALPAGTQDAHTYGGLQCGGDFSDSPENRLPNEYGWFCSREKWPSENYYPGRAFDLRDVDCYDQSPSHTAGAEWDDLVLDTGGGPGTEIVVRTTCASWHTT